MRSIFAKILLWFLGTLAFSLVAFALTSVRLSMREHDRGEFMSGIHALQLEDARMAYEDGGPEQLARYLRRLRTYFHDEHYLVDERGVDLATKADRSALLARASAEGPSGRRSSGPGLSGLVKRARAAFWPQSRDDGELVIVRGSDDRRYRFITVLRPRFRPWDFVPYYLWILLVMVLLSYMLAKDLASPLRSLRRAVEQFGRGDLGARIHSTRKDEFGVLSRAFDRMAERIETLLTAERRLLQDVSHELRSPLARLGFAVELARTSQNREASLARIRREVERLTSLVDELLELTRAEGDPSSRELVTIPLVESLQTLVDDCSVEADVRNCRLVLRIDHPAVLQGERRLLHRAIENVLRNAISHAPEGTPVEVSLGLVDGTATVQVRDYGCGVPEEMLVEIFKPFFRADGDRSRTSGGVGLGLAIARRAVGLHQGRISARNAQPGLIVTIELPYASPGPYLVRVPPVDAEGRGATRFVG